MIIAAIHPTFNAKNRRANLDGLTLAKYSIDDSNEAFTIDDLGNRDLVNVRDGNSVDYASENLRSQCYNAGRKARKSKEGRPKMLRADSHAWAASSAGAYWNTTEKMDETVKIVNHNKWLSIVTPVKKGVARKSDVYLS